MGRSRRLVWRLTAVALVGVGGTSVGVGAQAASRGQAAALVKATPARMLVTGQGMTLYVYAPDKKNKSVCYGQCAAFWPPMIVAPRATVPAIMAGLKGTFGVTTRTDGKHQLTYNGAPLYTFIKDKTPGQMAGQGLDVAGGYWWAVVAPPAAAGASAAESAQPAQPAPAVTATPSSGGYYGGSGGTIGDDHHRNRGDQTTPTPGSYYGGGHGGHGADG